MGGKVVYRALDAGAGGEHFHVLDEQGGFEGVGVIEVLEGALPRRQMGEIAVVEVEREQGGGELTGELAGECGFA